MNTGAEPAQSNATAAPPHSLWQRIRESMSWTRLGSFALGCGLILIQLVAENYLLKNWLGIPSQNLALVPLVMRVWAPSVPAGVYAENTVVIVIQPEYSLSVSTNCSIRARLLQLLAAAQQWNAGGVMIDMSFDPTDSCGGVTASLRQAMEGLCAGPAGKPLVVGTDPNRIANLIIRGERCSSGSLLLPSDLRSVPVGFDLNGSFTSDAFAFAVARLLHPERALEIESKAKESVSLYVKPGTWRPSYRFDDEDVINGLKHPKPDLYRLGRSIWIIGSAEDAAVQTEHGAMTGFELQASYVQALDTPDGYVHGFPPSIGYLALAFTALALWLLESKHRSWWDLLWMSIGIAVILGVNFFLIVIKGRYSDWTSVSVLTIIGWMFLVVKGKVPWLSNHTN